MAIRNFRKMGNKVVKYAKKRYLRKGAGYKTGVRFNKLAQDIQLIKSKLNTEKKYIDSGEVATTPVGQCINNLNGFACVDITPRPASGSGFSERTGKSIKLVALSLDYQIVQQANTSGPRKFCLYVIETKGTPVTPLTLATELMEVNPITSVIDYNSPRNINYFQKYKILMKKNIYLKDDNIAGQKQLTTGKVIMKLSHHIQFVNDTNQYSNGQICWMIVADSGNAGGTNSTLSNIAVTGLQTGASFQTYSRFWYVDN